MNFSADGDQMGWDAMKSDIFLQKQKYDVQRLLETRLLIVTVPFCGKAGHEYLQT